MTGEVPPPILDVLSAPEVAAAGVAMVVATLGAVAAVMRAFTKRVLSRLEEVGEHARDAAYGVTNSHATNLRDDLDQKFHSVFERMDAMETARQADAERARLELERSDRAADRRSTRAEAQIDGLRDDLRNLDERSQREHARLWIGLRGDSSE